MALCYLRTRPLRVSTGLRPQELFKESIQTME